MSKQIEDRQVHVELAVLSEKVENLGKLVAKVDERLDKHYVTQKEFKPVKTVVYGMLGAALLALLDAVLGGVVL